MPSPPRVEYKINFQSARFLPELKFKVEFILFNEFLKFQTHCRDWIAKNNGGFFTNKLFIIANYT